MGKYESLAKEIITNVGGTENINQVTHCVTRLRFRLKDEGKANDEAVKKMDGVITLIRSAGEYQVVIGNHVPDVYAEVCQLGGISQDTHHSIQDKQKKSLGRLIQEYMGAIFTPCLGILCASGILKGLLSILVITGAMAKTDGLYMVLDAAGDALFYFFPIFIGFTAATKLGMTPFLGMGIGAALVYPTIQNVEALFVFGINVSHVSYASTVIPILLVVILAAPLERWLKKMIPDVIKVFVVPMLVLMIAVPIGFTIIGPFANLISNGLSVVLIGSYRMSPVLAGILLASVWQVLVIFGVHHGVVMILIMDLIAGNPSPLMSILGVVSFAQTAVVFAIWLRTKDRKLKNVALPAWISGILGVTEPAIYGVTLPRVKFFVISCLGAAIGGAYRGLTRVTTYQMAGLGVFGLPGLLSPEAELSNFINGLISIGIAMVFSGVVTFILYRDDPSEEVEANAKQKIHKINSPVTGVVMSLSQIKDGAFSQKTLGAGVAIYPEAGKIVAPADGVLNTFFPTHHAIGLTTDKGVELLIHIGMDTIQLEGQYFSPKVTQGEAIVKGQVLLEFDLKAIEEAGYSLVTPVIITNTKSYTDVFETDAKTVSFEDPLISIIC